MAKFGEGYDIGTSGCYLGRFIAEGMVKYSPKEKVYISAYNRFPLFYTYDAKTLEIQDTYQIFDFILGKQRYWPDSGHLEVTMEDHSAIKNIRFIEEQYVLLEVVTRRKADQEVSG